MNLLVVVRGGGHPAVEIWLKILPRKSYLHRVPKIHFHFLQYIWFLLTDFSNFLVIAIRNGQRVYLSLLIAIFQVNLGQIVTVNKSTPNSLQTGCPSRRWTNSALNGNVTACIWNKIRHFTLTALLHYLAKKYIFTIMYWVHYCKKIYYLLSWVGVLASEGWWEAWQPFPKVTRSY